MNAPRGALKVSMNDRLMGHPGVIAASYFGVGLLFAAGLGISGMTSPEKVVSFLDVSGNWDPSLALVMVGAIGVHLAMYRWIVNRPSPLMALHFGIPTRQDITPRLLLGAVMFGLGWGLGGYCPGPGLVGAGAGAGDALLFSGAMMVGMQAFQVVDRWLEHRATGA